MTATHLERQLRATVDRIMGAETAPAARVAQLRQLDALMTLETAATLLGTIEDMRELRQLDGMPKAAELWALLPGVQYMDPPDGGAPTLLEQLQRMAEDARSWREFVRNNPPPAPAPLPDWSGMKLAPEPIPDHVYYMSLNDNFYSTLTGCGMGIGFFHKWLPRKAEFPSPPATMATPPLHFSGPGVPVYENPASKRELRPGMPGYNDGSKREGST